MQAGNKDIDTVLLAVVHTKLHIFKSKNLRLNSGMIGCQQRNMINVGMRAVKLKLLSVRVVPNHINIMVSYRKPTIHIDADHM
ncbi:hypothetical protein D3C78_1707700 [compost metagenome]